MCMRLARVPVRLVISTAVVPSLLATVVVVPCLPPDAVSVYVTAACWHGNRFKTVEHQTDFYALNAAPVATHGCGVDIPDLRVAERTGYVLLQVTDLKIGNVLGEWLGCP